MPSPSTPKPSAAAISPFGKNSQNAALLGKGAPQAPSSSSLDASSSSSSKKGPSTPKGSKSPAGGGGGNRSISLSARSSPQPSRFQSSPSPGPSSSKYDPTGLLSRDQETTYHRQSRSNLLAFTNAARTWEEVATFDGLKWAKQAVDSWNDLYSARELGKPASNGPKAKPPPSSIRKSGQEEAESRLRALMLDPKQAIDPITGPGGLRETRMADALNAIEAAEDGLNDVIERLTKALTKLTQASESLRNILEESATRKGLEFAFQEPLWGTWSMDRFVEKTSELTSQYQLSTSHLKLLVPTLIRSGEPKTKPGQGSRSDDSKPDPNGERRKAYEAWIALPYLETRGQGSLPWFESLCEVEVGRWRE